jgi:hypothetical protein
LLRSLNALVNDNTLAALCEGFQLEYEAEAETCGHNAHQNCVSSDEIV